MAETIITGKKYRILTDVTNKIWSRISFWTKASDVECNDGTTVETKVGNIKGLVDTFSVTEDGYVMDAKKVAELNSNLGGLSFYEDATGKYVVGADSVPKKLGSGTMKTKTLTSSSNNPTLTFTESSNIICAGVASIQCTIYSYAANYNHWAGFNTTCTFSGKTVTVKLSGGNNVDGSKGVTVIVNYICE